MSLMAIGFGGVLALVGIGAYILSWGASVTALIPAFIGLPIVGLGVAAQIESLRKSALYSALALAALGFLGSAGGLGKLAALLSGGGVQRPFAVVVQSITAATCALFIVALIVSMIKGRREAPGAQQ